LPARSLPPIQKERLSYIDIYMKEMFNVWDAHFLLSHLIDQNKLEHENDGLIFTVDECPYYPGTCFEILKWKPQEKNSVDFKLGQTKNSNIFTLRTSDQKLYGFIVL
jgi:hypothetical protein